jgi:hypothetical protein
LARAFRARQPRLRMVWPRAAASEPCGIKANHSGTVRAGREAGVERLGGYYCRALREIGQAALNPIKIDAKELAAAFRLEAQARKTVDWLTGDCRPAAAERSGADPSSFERVAARLALAGYRNHAEKLVDIEEHWFPEQKGVSRAVVETLVGDRKSGLAALRKIAKSKKRAARARALALEALIEIDCSARLCATAARFVEWCHLEGDCCAALRLSAALVSRKAGIDIHMYPVSRDDVLIPRFVDPALLRFSGPTQAAAEAGVG